MSATRVIAIDAATEKVRWRVAVPGMPHHMTVTRDGKFIFVPLYNGPWTAVVDTEKHAVVDRIGTGFGSHGTRLSPDGKRLYVGSMMNHQIAVVDVATRQVIKRISFDDSIRPFEMTRDESGSSPRSRAYTDLTWSICRSARSSSACRCQRCLPAPSCPIYRS